MKDIIWVGKYFSDVINTDLFCAAILVTQPLYDTNIPIYVYNNSLQKITTSNKNFILFAYHTIKSLLLKKDYVFMFYSDAIAKALLTIDASLSKYFICTNEDISSWLSLKGYTRLWLSKSVEIPPIKVVSKDEITFNNLQKTWREYDKFVIQKDFSSGGKGTYIVTKDSINNILKELSEYNYYMLSPYIEHEFSGNNHLFITNKDIIISPASISTFEYANNKKLFNGSCFKALPFNISEVILKNLNNIGKKLQDIGYIGICGIDYIITKDTKFYFIEVNTRFQGSSYVLNEYLYKQFKVSLFDIQLSCFNFDTLLKYKEMFDKLHMNCIYSTQELNIQYQHVTVYNEANIVRYLYNL